MFTRDAISLFLYTYNLYDLNPVFKVTAHLKSNISKMVLLGNKVSMDH